MKNRFSVRLVYFLSLWFLFSSCNSEKANPQITDGNSKDIFLKEPSLIIVSLNEDQLYEMKSDHGEVGFYTLADDLAFQLNDINRKMNNLDIPVVRVSRDTLTIHANNSTQDIVKEKDFSIFTYFLFDGEKLERKEYEELMSLN